MGNADGDGTGASAISSIDEPTCVATSTGAPASLAAGGRVAAGRSAWLRFSHSGRDAPNQRHSSTATPTSKTIHNSVSAPMLDEPCHLQLAHLPWRATSDTPSKGASIARRRPTNGLINGPFTVSSPAWGRAQIAINRSDQIPQTSCCRCLPEADSYPLALEHVKLGSAFGLFAEVAAAPQSGRSMGGALRDRAGRRVLLRVPRRRPDGADASSFTSAKHAGPPCRSFSHCGVRKWNLSG